MDGTYQRKNYKIVEDGVFLKVILEYGNVRRESKLRFRYGSLKNYIPRFVKKASKMVRPPSGDEEKHRVRRLHIHLRMELSKPSPLFNHIC